MSSQEISVGGKDRRERSRDRWLKGNNRNKRRNERRKPVNSAECSVCHNTMDTVLKSCNLVHKS